MNLNSFRSLFFKGSAVLASTAVVAAMTGCGIGTLQAGNSTDTIVPALHGVVHGGVSPDVGARVVLYSTTSTGYGVGNFLQEATQVGASAHQDTDSNGGFSFTGGYTCPAGQYAYIANYGGNAGGGVNPNIVMITALGPCSGLNSSTFIYISEATTVAAAYALANFITVTGDAVNGYTVGIGAPATNNNGATGCVSNAYYTTAACPATQAAGLAHAFTNATALVNPSNGTVNATTNGATIPATEINTLADIVQACVNSSGGGTNGSGLPTTTTTTSGTSHDGTACGKLSAFTSYTNTGLFSGTLTAAGNTLDAVKNLVKRPAGTASTFNGTCDSNSGGGGTSAVSCLFALVNGTSAAYVPAMSAAPPDWMLGISYPKGSLSNSTSSNFGVPTGPSCAANTSTNNGLLYPAWVQSDINDDILILNTDASTPVCANVIQIGPDGTVYAASPIDNSQAAVVSLGVDSWGHAIVPIQGGGTGGLGVRLYQYQPPGAAFVSGDGPFMALAETVFSSGTNLGPTTTTVAYKAGYVEVDANNRLYSAAQNGQNDFGYLAPTTLSHTAPVHTAVSLTTTTTSALTSISIDVNNNAFTTTSTQLSGTGGTGFTKATASGGSTGTGNALQTDSSGNLWQIKNNGAVVGTSQTVVVKDAYTSSSGTITFNSPQTVAAPTYSFPTNTNLTSLNGGLNVGAKASAMDGNNVLWFVDFFGQASTAPSYGSWLRGYDTVNNYGTPQLLGCKFFPPGTFSVTAWNIGASSTTFTISNSTPPPVGAIVTLSGFSTGTFFNGIQVTVSANSTGPSTFTVASNFGQVPSNATETGSGTGRPATACGNNTGDTSNPSNIPFLMYSTRGITVDTMGNLWVANGTQGQVNEILGIAAPTWPNYIHNGTSNKP